VIFESLIIDVSKVVERIVLEVLLFDFDGFQHEPLQHFTMYRWGERGRYFPVKASGFKMKLMSLGMLPKLPIAIIRP
jgi:hypothetical protein